MMAGELHGETWANLSGNSTMMVFAPFAVSLCRISAKPGALIRVGTAYCYIVVLTCNHPDAFCRARYWAVLRPPPLRAAKGPALS